MPTKAHPVDCFYVNVKGDHAAGFADYVASELNQKGIKFQLKVPSEIKGYARVDSGLVYTQGKDFDAVRGVISKYRDLHPAAIAEGSPAIAKPQGNCRSRRTHTGGTSLGTARTASERRGRM